MDDDHSKKMSNRALGIASHILLMAIAISLVLLFLGITITVLIHVCIVGRTLRQGIFSDSNLNNVERGNSSMSRYDIEKLPCFDFKASEKATSPVADCAVCLEKFSVGEKCRLLPSCNHSFHADCVDLWLLRTPICPICRGRLDFDEESGGVSESGVAIAEGGEIAISVQVSNTRSEENGDCNSDGGVEVGLNQTIMENIGVEHSWNNFGDRQTRGEYWSSSEVVIEVGESHDQEMEKNNFIETVNEDVQLNRDELMLGRKL